MASDYPYGRNKLDKRPDPPPPRSEPDELDRTARQVRLDHEGTAVHRVTNVWRCGRIIYRTACDDVMSKQEGAILTTREATCEACRG
jgi:hypothetical protein